MVSLTWVFTANARVMCTDVTLKRKCHHSQWRKCITSCTGSCQSDKFQCSQWWKCHQSEDISFSVMTSPIINNLTACPIACSGWHQGSIQASHYLSFWEEFTGDLVDFPRKAAENAEHLPIYHDYTMDFFRHIFTKSSISPIITIKTIEVCEWMGNFIPYFILNVIIYNTCWD